MTSTIGIPIKLLNEAQNHVITLEITSGQVYRGKLIEAEDNMNVQLKDITVTARDGRVSHLDQVYIRGSHKRAHVPVERNTRTRGGTGKRASNGEPGKGSERIQGSMRRLCWEWTPKNEAIVELKSHEIPTNATLRDPTLSLSTPYYSATVPVWHDILPLSTSELRQWDEEWRGEEAGEVVRAVGAWVVIFRKAVPDERNGEGEGEVTLPKLRTLLTTISTLLTHHASAASSYAVAPDPLLFAVGVHQPLNPCLELSTEEWEDLCRECGGWEWIDGEVGGEMGKGKVDRDEFGEKIGLPRLLEALEANDWSADLNSDPNNDDLEIDSDFDSILDTIEISETGLGRPKSSATQPQELDLRAGLLEVQQTFQTEEDGQGEGEGEGADSQVQELEAMMLKMQAVKDMSSDMPEAERRKFAARAVRGILRGVPEM